MKQTLIIFIAAAVVGFSGGFFAFEGFGKSDSASESASTEVNDSSTSEESAGENEAPEAKEEESNQDSGAETVSASGEILDQRGCLACHSVSSLNLEGGATGPDLSDAYTSVEGKHGKPIGEFLKEPTSAVMSSVIGGQPLTDEEHAAVLEALKAASEK
ncbi:cytochrome C [Bacillus marinisedimentorum]|uniref:cytochrome C n=1 Tax=Bacillus marinisedimentorum TaxID=1821260 RepID=UPI000872A67D|nr:cytochrome C [Bacillus marinisedimentorum]